MVKKIDNNSTRGKRSRAAGTRFELKVRTHLESDKWIVDKWTNNVDVKEGKLVKAKRKYNPFLKALSVGTGFPDFIAFKLNENKSYKIIGVESKSNGWLDKEEKEKSAWLLRNNVFEDILVASKGKKKGEIEYKSLKEKLG